MSNMGSAPTIEVPGVPAGLQTLAKKDIGILLRAILRAAQAQGNAIPAQQNSCDRLF